jgi:hypothetical protein
MRSEWRDFEERQRDSEGSGLRLIGLATALAVGFLLGTHYFREREPVLDPVTTPQVAMPEPEEASPRPREQPRPSQPPVRGGAAQPRAQSLVGVYECRENGQRVVSDRPCGSGATTRTLAVDQPDPREVARQRQQTRAAGAVTASVPGTTVNAGATRCIYVRSRVTGEEKVHTCRWFDSFQSCKDAADRIHGYCGRSR